MQTWRWQDAEEDSRVSIELAGDAGSTDLVVVHDRLDADTAEAYRAGWESCLARLPGYLTSPENR